MRTEQHTIKKRSLKRCFISAPFAANLKPLTDVLDRAEIDWEWAKSGSTHAERLPADLRKLIRDVDFVLGVLLGGTSDTNTSFEVGVAVGAGKPVLLIIANDSQLPFHLSGLPHLRASLEDEKAIELHLDLLRRSVRQGLRFSGPGGSTAALSPGIRKGQPTHSHPNSAFEAELARLIESAGGRVVLQPHSEDPNVNFRPDMLIWLPSGDTDLLSPAVLEAKSAPMAPTGLAETQQQLLVFMQHTGVRTGLIIVSEIPLHRQADVGGTPLLNIFVLDYETFRGLLAEGRLVDHLRRERNRAAHGIR